MNDGLAKVADGFSLIAEGIRRLNECGINAVNELPKGKLEQTEKPEAAAGKAKEEKAELKVEDIRLYLQKNHRVVRPKKSVTCCSNLG